MGEARHHCGDVWGAVWLFRRGSYQVLLLIKGWELQPVPQLTSSRFTHAWLRPGLGSVPWEGNVSGAGGSSGELKGDTLALGGLCL